MVAALDCGALLLRAGAHAVKVEGVRGHKYEKPVPAMRTYLDAMDGAPYMAPTPARPGRSGALMSSSTTWTPACC